MDERLQIIRRLYDDDSGAPGRAEAGPRPAAPSVLDQEEAELREMKRLLDDRPRHRPDRRALEAVLAAAAGETLPRPPGRRDRAPVPPRARRSRLYMGVGSTMAVLLMVGLSWWGGTLPSSEPATGDRAAAPAAEADAAGESFLEALRDEPPVAEAPVTSVEASRDDEAQIASARPSASVLAGPSEPAEPIPADVAVRPAAAAAREGAHAVLAATAAPEGGAESPEALSWDETERIRELHRRIEVLREGMGLAWGDAVPLEGGARGRAAPAPSPGGLQQVGQQPTPEW